MTDLQLFLLGFVAAELLSAAIVVVSFTAWATRDDFNGECE